MYEILQNVELIHKLELVDKQQKRRKTDINARKNVQLIHKETDKLVIVEMIQKIEKLDKFIMFKNIENDLTDTVTQEYVELIYKFEKPNMYENNKTFIHKPEILNEVEERKEIENMELIHNIRNNEKHRKRSK